MASRAAFLLPSPAAPILSAATNATTISVSTFTCRPHKGLHATLLYPHPLPARRVGRAPRTPPPQPTTATLVEDLLTGPSSPPRPRPLSQVVLFSATTNLLWYGFYKFCVEEELRRETGHGPGGYVALVPFVLGVTAPLYVPPGHPAAAAAGVAAGVAWIVGVQFWLYRRINEVVRDHFGFRPLTPWWVIVPGLNLVVGLRSVHFLATAWGANPRDDAVVAYFPFLAVNTLDAAQLLTTPALWFGKQKQQP